MRGQRDEGDEPGEDPNIGEAGDDGAFLEFLGKPGDDEELDGIEELRGDGEEVGLEDGEAEFAQDVGEVGCWWGRWDVLEEGRWLATDMHLG